MKRLLLIFLLTVLPLQMSLAAVTSYCHHENGKAAQHLGHHEHKHKAQTDSPDDQEKLLQVHSDCGYCHGVTQASFLTPSPPMVIPLGSIYVESHPLSFPSHIPDGPRRPDRHPVA